MSRHWNPEQELARLRLAEARAKPRPEAAATHSAWTLADDYALPAQVRRKGSRSGAIVGLALVAAACVGICAGLYQVLGPTDVFASED